LSRRHAFQIFRAALEAADPRRAVLDHLHFDGRILMCGRRRYRMDDFGRVFVVGAGKAGAAMASAVERVLGRRIAGGLVNVPDGVAARLRHIRLNPAGHPIPDERGVAGAREIADIARAAGERDLIVGLISGGASALLPLPARGVSLEQKRGVTAALLRAGATIHELNTVRKHLSAIKGGHLAALAQPAPVVALIISDVVGDDLDAIGSGPTVGDRSTVSEARAVLAKYGVRAPRLHETPKSSPNAQNVIVCSNRAAIAAAVQRARELGYHTYVLSTAVQGEAREVAAAHAAVARQVLAEGRPVRRPACILSGGETTVTVRGSGRGGRNLEFVLAAAIALNGMPGVTVFSAGTDGIDGPTDAAGAIADEHTLRRAAAAGLDPRAALAENDSYTFFAGVNGLVKTGPTGTNVMDVQVLLIV
jgi:glycerate 2-kinase